MHLKTTPSGVGGLRAARKENRYGDYRCKDGKWKRKPRWNEIACAFAVTSLLLGAGAYAWLERGNVGSVPATPATLPSSSGAGCAKASEAEWTWHCGSAETRRKAAQVKKWFTGKEVAASPKREEAPANHVVLGHDIRSYATDPKHEAKVAAIVARMPGMATAAQAEAYVRSRFKASPVTGEMAYAAAKKHGVPLKLVVAIMEQDSSLGTAGKGARTKNPGNVGNDDRGNIVVYKTWSSGVEAVAKWLSKHKAPEAVALGD